MKCLLHIDNDKVHNTVAARRAVAFVNNICAKRLETKQDCGEQCTELLQILTVNKIARIIEYIILFNVSAYS